MANLSHHCCSTLFRCQCIISGRKFSAYFHADSRDCAREALFNILAGMFGRCVEEIRISDPLSYQDMVESGKNSDPNFRIFEIFDEKAKAWGWVDSPLFFSLDKSLLVEWVLFLVQMSANLLNCGRDGHGNF